MGEPISISISASIGQVKFEYNSPPGAVLKSSAASSDIVLKILALVADITESESIINGRTPSADIGPDEEGGYTYGVDVYQPELGYAGDEPETVRTTESMRPKNDKVLAKFMESGVE